MMSLKVDSFLKPFRGTSSEDFDVFWQKFSVLAKIQKWSDDAAMLLHLPLFLEGDAFLVFSKMADDDRKTMKEVEAKFREAFSCTPAAAYRQFVGRRLKPDESVDAYVADVQRLLALSGHQQSSDDDPVVVEQFIAGLPTEFARQLRLNKVGKKLAISNCMEYVRVLRATSQDVRASVGIGETVVAAVNEPSTKKILCFHCHEVGHMRKNCPKRKRGGLACFFCEQPGHVRSDCPERAAWLSRKGRTAAVEGKGASGSGTNDPCLLTTAKAKQRTALPRMYVDVHKIGMESEDWNRLVAVIDTGSTHTLVSSAHVERAEIIRSKESGDGLVALDGQPLAVIGCVNIRLRRLDGAARLPEISVRAFVVQDLHVVNADVLIGADVVAGSNGLHFEYKENDLCRIQFGPDTPVVGSAADSHPMSHVTVTFEGDDVVLSSSDGAVRWKAGEGCWELAWRWKDGEEPSAPIGSGLGEYSRSRLTPHQEGLFQAEVEKWIESGWLVPHNPEVHGQPAAVLPLIAQVQEHKATTPVRPVLDYRLLNKHLISTPGRDAVVCEETLRKWRKDGDPSELALLDIKKAYLQVHVAPELLRFQTVIWKGQLFVMTRMGFGLSIAPKFMNMIVRWITRGMPAVDNYVDDLKAPRKDCPDVASKLAEHGLPTKPAEPFAESRVLGLQLSKDEETVMWRRRDRADLELPSVITKRAVFQWCGRLTGHVPVCGWLRPACSMLKRIAGVDDEDNAIDWDEEVSVRVARYCRELEARITKDGGDPARGRWQVSMRDDTCVQVWCDASSIALGVCIEIDGDIVEDKAWLRPADDNRHINVAELEAAIRGLNLAVSWNAKKLTLRTDSRTVASWLRDVVENLQRSRMKGLHEVLVQRRLQIVADLIQTAELDVSVVWVESHKNRADALTRVPSKWLSRVKETESPIAAGAVPVRPVTGALTLEQIKVAQKADPEICAAVESLLKGDPLPWSFSRMKSQLVVDDGLLCRSVKLPVDGEVVVPVIPATLEQQALRGVHETAGHCTWSSMHDLLRAECYFPGMAKACREYVDTCARCRAACPGGATSVPPTRAAVSGRPWSEVVLDTLELGVDRTGRYHCVLVVVDTFTKWAEVMPLRQHAAQCVAEAFTTLCMRWGPPQVVRTDNGTEFQNAVVRSLFQFFGVVVKTGAVRHPQSQGSAERFNRTLLGLIRKVLDDSHTWKEDLEMLLRSYRIRPHGATGISPMEAMVGWKPDIIVQKEDACEFSAWCSQLKERSARIRDLVESELSSGDFVNQPMECPYGIGDDVLLARPDRHQKCLTPFESGWTVKKVVAPSTVVIRSIEGGEKVVNVSLIKRDPGDPFAAAPRAEEPIGDGDVDMEISLVSDGDAQESGAGYNLRPRSGLAPPERLSF